MGRNNTPASRRGWGRGGNQGHIVGAQPIWFTFHLPLDPLCPQPAVRRRRSVQLMEKRMDKGVRPPLLPTHSGSQLEREGEGVTVGKFSLGLCPERLLAASRPQLRARGTWGGNLCSHSGSVQRRSAQVL